MTDTWFVPQTGSKDDAKNNRKLIRRQVMLGKNRGKSRDPRPPTLQGCAVSRLRDWEEAIRPSQPRIPRRVGSDLSFLEFAEAVEPSLMSETLHFCSTTKEKLFVLEPCISFGSDDVSSTCLESLAYDALHLNVMVFGAQAYMDQVFWQATSTVRKNPHNGALQHYGRALQLLRKSLADSALYGFEVSDMTIMSIITLAVHALVGGEDKNARNHIAGLAELVGMRKNGVRAFMGKVTLVIEILRCDISISLATGQLPLFFSNANTIQEIPLPELPALDRPPQDTPTILSSELAELWNVLIRFSAVINKAAISRRKFSDQTLLNTMTSVMYRLLKVSTVPGSTDEAICLGMVSFCVSVFLTWSHLRMPLKLVKEKYMRSISCLIKSYEGCSDPEMILWNLLTYVEAFSPILGDERLQVQSWLAEVTAFCGLTTWNGVRMAMDGFLWIDVVYVRAAQKLVEEVFSRRTAAIDKSLYHTEQRFE